VVSRLIGKYQVLQASDGQEGYDLAASQLPDLIISDVMMPLIDGINMMKMIRQNISISMTPIILLTAKTAKKEVVEGLKTGADDYLTKPFDTAELMARVDGLINSRKKIREAIKLELSKSLTQLDRNCSFVEKLNHMIAKNLSDPHFTVENLANEMAVSRFTLNRKCQNETNKSASQLIAETRLQHALNLLKNSEYSVSEIAYGTGFESLTYFSRSFKKHYKKTPSEVRIHM
jgi:YesN/AraC family two-component response regulator